MGRKTYSFSALAVAAAATLGFSGVDGAKALAQDTFAGTGASAEVSQVASAQRASSDQEGIELVPQPTIFVSNEIVQELPEETIADETPATQAGSLRELVALTKPAGELSEEMQCLAGAVYFESRGEPLAGQLAVAKVVINRSEDSRWPSNYCGVVYQRSQFSFVKNRKMPRINTSSQAWARARAVATIAHKDLWDTPAADAVYFHANYVSPRWSRAKTKLAQIDTHIFYR